MGFYMRLLNILRRFINGTRTRAQFFLVPIIWVGWSIYIRSMLRDTLASRLRLDYPLLARPRETGHQVRTLPLLLSILLTLQRLHDESLLAYHEFEAEPTSTHQVHQRRVRSKCRTSCRNLQSGGEPHGENQTEHQ